MIYIPFCVARLAETVFQEMEVRHAQGVKQLDVTIATSPARTSAALLAPGPADRCIKGASSIGFSRSSITSGAHCLEGVNDGWLAVWDRAGEQQGKTIQKDLGIVTGRARRKRCL